MAKPKVQKSLKESSETRVTRAIKSLVAVSNLNSFKPTAKQTEAIVSALRKAVDIVETKLKTPPAAKKGEKLFSLDV